MQEYKIKIQKKIEIAENVIELLFSKPKNFIFKSGQFVQLLIPNNDKTTPRSYSIVSTPTEKNLKFCIKLLDNGLASNYFEKMQLNDEINIRGPFGHLIANENAKAQMFIATGTGIAPIMSIIKDLYLNKGYRKRMHLLFGVRYEKDIFWRKELNEMDKNFENFSYQICLSQPDNNWSGQCGRVTAHLSDIELSAHFYICGNKEMVIETKKSLSDAGVESDKVHFEIF